jgi:hypothetical protein
VKGRREDGAFQRPLSILDAATRVRVTVAHKESQMSIMVHPRLQKRAGAPTIARARALAWVYEFSTLTARSCSASRNRNSSSSQRRTKFLSPPTSASPSAQSTAKMTRSNISERGRLRQSLAPNSLNTHVYRLGLIIGPAQKLLADDQLDAGVAGDRGSLVAITHPESPPRTAPRQRLRSAYKEQPL